MAITTILQAMRDKKLFGQWFDRNWLGKDTWRAWKVLLAAIFALPMDAAEREVFKKFTNRDDLPTEQVSEAFFICGRRSGKSLIAALIAVYLACFRTYEKILAPGEIGTVMIIASDKRQARVILGYINGFFDAVAMLSRMIESRTKESITLSNRVRIEVHTASFRSVRGYTVIAAILDEIAFFATGDSANPDEEIVNALRPAMATVPGALLLGISSPYARRGVLWQAFNEHYGKASAPALVWKAATREMNPTVSLATIALAYARDASAAGAEYGALFRSDIENFLTLEIVERCMRERHELPPLSDVNYIAFVDPSGGQSDSMTLAIAHLESDIGVLDALREVQAPFSPESAVTQFASDLKRYRVSTVVGDRYAGEWPREQFQKRGIEYRTAELTRSELYLELLPALMSGRVELLRNARLVAQLVSLERRTARSGKDSVDHAPGGHDDLANSVAGVMALVLADSAQLGLVEWMKSGGVERTLADIDTKLATVFASSKPAEPVAESLACPACASTQIQTLSPIERRCAQCGKQWWPNGAPEVARVGFKNLPSAGQAQMNSGAFHEARARFFRR
jgi:hypothetical protein